MTYVGDCFFGSKRMVVNCLVSTYLGFCLRESYVAEKEPQCANLRFDDVSSLQTFTVDSTLACVIVSHARNYLEN